MKITVFQSDKGDCLLLESADQPARRLLIDGGMRESYTKFVARAMARLGDSSGALDVVCVSHIDNDHISGIIQLLNDAVDWRVYDYHKASGNRRIRRPVVGRPPEVKEVWHNGFHEQLGENASPIDDMLASTAAALAGLRNDVAQDLARQCYSIAFGVREGIRLSRRLGAGQLNIPLNKPCGGKLMMVHQQQAPVHLGSMVVHLIGPFREELAALRDEWNGWLRDNRDALAKIREAASEDERRLGLSEFQSLVRRITAEAEALGRREKVTVPNLASIMLYVEEGGRSILLTGDGHHEHIVKGLEWIGKLKPRGRLHVDVMKIPHHGSEHNSNEEFFRRVTATHYVFCGNGSHKNPDIRILQALLNSRLHPDAGADGATEFRLWFNSSVKAVTGQQECVAHMTDVEQLIRSTAARSRGRMTCRFLKASSFHIDL